MIATARLNLIGAETGELEALITNYKDVFAMKSSEYRHTNRVYHHISDQFDNPNEVPCSEAGRSGQNA
jgi:hypothetical protein